jgi:hypothetical protein
LILSYVNDHAATARRGDAAASNPGRGSFDRGGSSLRHGMK